VTAHLMVGRGGGRGGGGGGRERRGREEGLGWEDHKVMWSRFLSWRDLESSCALLDEAAKGAVACGMGESPGAGTEGGVGAREGGWGRGEESHAHPSAWT